MRPKNKTYPLANQFFYTMLLMFMSISLSAQTKFTKANYLQGKLTPLRTCFNVVYQDITVKVEPAKKFITVCNKLTFKTEADFKTIQLDLFAVMNIDSIVFENNKLVYNRDSNAFFITFPKSIKKGSINTISVYASGNPPVAKKAPWDGGFVWSKDDNKSDWIGLACEGLGASCWLPCKDHWSDEADSVDIHLQVPNSLMGVSNGQYLGYRDLDNGFTEYNWAVKNTINNYNISINIANYALISDTYMPRANGSKSPLSLKYYVLQNNKTKAEDHFKQTHKMLEAFEKYFGPYPFYSDGYKLVETPYWGMEHQSCVAYGNDYQNNKWGFDFIIVHESGHEWFGNSLTATDPGDMWIHESFTTYSEALYVEYWSGKEEAKKYLQSQYKHIENNDPVVGPYDVNFDDRKDNDIYYKGSWMLHTLRNVIDDDTLWFNMIRDFSTTYARSNLNTQDVIRFFEKRSGMDLQAFFQQYLYTASLPVLEYKIETKYDGRMVMSYHWQNAVKGFAMPVKVTATKGKFETITPNKKWQLIDLNYFDESDFKILPDSYLIKIEKMKEEKK
jgi:aminopeptidase N